MESPSMVGIGLASDSIRKTIGTANFATDDQFKPQKIVKDDVDELNKDCEQARDKSDY